MGLEKLSDLWRVCRTVSQAGRLKLLWLLFEADELCVNQLQAGAEMTRPNASIQLKALYSGGLIRFRREGMNVIYRAEADTRVEFAEELLRALENCCKQSVPLESVVRQVTAFTHERRVEIVRALKDRPLSFVQLKDRCNMTSSALSRHLLKLEARKVVRWDGAVYERSIPDGHLGKTLLNIVCSEPHNKQKAVT